MVNREPNDNLNCVLPICLASDIHRPFPCFVSYETLLKIFQI